MPGIKTLTWFRAILAMLLAGSGLLEAQVVLRYEEHITPTWEECIAMYRWLDESHEEARLLEIGTTDAGKPLHLFLISREGQFSPEEVQQSGKSILFINNAIHPGEPCGVDASLKLAHELLSGADDYRKYLDQCVLAIVPMFNVGGALNRSPHHRANQNGPLEQGFRGNARNLDLNRDFVKMDALNTRSLVQALQAWEPEIFVDTHTSNGADYPYTITLINSHEQRHEPSQAVFLKDTLKPWLFQQMKQSPYEMIPYVWSRGTGPQTGILAFMDYPRYTSGYASLFNSLAFTVETHMFKPYADRVLSTWHLLRAMLRFSSEYREPLQEARRRAWDEKLARQEFVLEWALDTSRFDWLPFRGYALRRDSSLVTGQERIWYDRKETWEREIPYYRYFRPVRLREAPGAYVIPQAWREVIQRLQLNGVSMTPLERDTLMEVEVSYVDQYKTYPRPYNGHFKHHEVRLREEREVLSFQAGDYLVPTDQKAREYLVQTLEADAYDSFFSWNFFDEILFRNEYFSSYVFEEKALEILEGDAALKTAFEGRKKSDPEFAANARAQLTYIYERSPWSEPTYKRYPVYRIVK